MSRKLAVEAVNRIVINMPSHFIKSATNFRDLSSVLAAPSLRPHTLYRSDHLGALDQDDSRQIAALGVRRVLDFRGVNERSEAVCALAGVTVHSLPIEPTIVGKLAGLMDSGYRLTAADTVALMQDTYRGFVRHNTPRFADFFALLLASDEPTVFHCTAGKDRTGFAAALILRALGVNQAVVMRDYLLTNERFRPPANPRRDLPDEVHAVLWGVQPAFLEAAFDEIESAHGGLDAYLREQLGLGAAQRERLAQLYLEPAR
jgi:protein-tyrosine phosphatase